MPNDVALRWIWSETWWSWNRPANDPLQFHDYACHYVNLVEATAWLVFAVLVLKRWVLNRRSSLGLIYALAFVAFGVSDAIEAWRLTSWLLWWKAGNLAALLWLRSTIIRRFYPASKLF